MNAERLGVRPGMFDAALMLFVLFHVADPLRALREVRAALRPEGRLGIVVWGDDPGLPGREIWSEELDKAGAAPDPRDASVMRQTWMDTPPKLTDLLEHAGFATDRVWSNRFVHTWEIEALWATQTQCGLPSRRLESLSADAARECASRVRERLEQLAPDALEYRTEVIYGIAKRPG
jgi:SAM-dependent methyltransferase